MASRTISSRSALKAYCLRRLGHPVIDINVDDEQVEDRIEDALIYFRDFHYDGTERVIYKHVITALNITNQYVTLPDNIIGVTSIFDIGRTNSTNNLFNIRYQMQLNDMFNVSAATMLPYVMAKRQIEEIEQILIGSKPIRFNRNTNILNIDMDWSNNVVAGDYIIIDGYRTIDGADYSDVWNDQWLKKYATALIKRQWGENLKKFEGMNLPGGISFNGQKIWEEANAEINALEERMNIDYSLPVADMMG